MNGLKYISALVLLAAFFSCGPSENEFKIEGKFKDMQDGELYIYNLTDAHARFDTLKVKGGSFVYSGKADGPTPYMLVFQNAMEQVIFVDGGKILKYEASVNDMKNYVVKGSDENKLLNEFRSETSKMTAIKTKAAARTFIENHPASPVSVYMLDRYFVQDENIVYDELNQLISIIRKQQPNNIFLIDLQTNLKMVADAAVGKKLPKLKMTTKTDKTIDLSEHKKPFTLLAFWAVWMDGQWDFMPKIREYSRDYSDQMEVVAISLDNQIYRWEEAIRGDSLTVNNVCDGKAWDSEPVKKLGVKDLPSYVLADKSGTIVARGNSIEDMESDVKKLVKKNDKSKESSSDKSEEGTKTDDKDKSEEHVLGAELIDDDFGKTPPRNSLKPKGSLKIRKSD